MLYRVSYTDAADAERRSLSPGARRDVKQVYRALRAGPYVMNALELEGFKDTLRIRVGKLRVIYRVDRERRLIRIIRVRPRTTAYEGMERPRRRDR